MNWNEVLEWDKDQLDDLRHVGYLYIRQGQYDVALALFEALAILSNESFYDIATLGALHLQKGSNLSALEYFDKAIMIEPKNQDVTLNRAKALFALGYKRQGMFQAKLLQKSIDKHIADQASALIMAYS
ncbi:MAG: type III secretion chaperone [Chlamydiae bacterium]|nr:type III secretion chaperone [Chlamydiota bacterium]